MFEEHFNPNPPKPLRIIESNVLLSHCETNLKLLYKICLTADSVSSPYSLSLTLTLPSTASSKRSLFLSMHFCMFACRPLYLVCLFCIFAYTQKRKYSKLVMSALRPHFHSQPLQQSEPDLGDGCPGHKDSTGLSLPQNNYTPSGNKYHWLYHFSIHRIGSCPCLPFFVSRPMHTSPLVFVAIY